MTSYRIYFEGFMNTEQESEDEATQEVYDRLKEIATIKITDSEEN
jgi:methionyl-tRNA synthetase